MTGASDNPKHRFLINNVIRLMSTVCRHILPICLTAAFILVAWMVITLPIVGVFIIDGIDEDAFVSGYVDFVFYATGVGFAISALIIFPLALLLERIVMRAKALIVLIPVCALVISGICLVVRFLLTEAFLDTLFSWTGVLFAFSLVFGVYWSVLWLERAVIYGFRNLIRKASAQQKKIA
jgi:hypothetical protein